MINPSDFIKRNGIWLPRMQFANPLGMWQVCESGCCTTVDPMSCEDTGKPICYVDKYATGAGDGSSWTDAYTTIQAAITAKASTERIYIKGYGKADPYSENLSGNAYTLIASGDTWINGIITHVSLCCFFGINVKGSSGYFNGTGGGGGNKYVLCRVEDSNASYGFSVSGTVQSTLTSCTVYNLTGTGNTRAFYGNMECTNCVASYVSTSGSSGVYGFSGGSHTGCSADNLTSLDYGGIAVGFVSFVSCTDCSSDDITGWSSAGGFNGGGTADSCTATTIVSTNAYAAGFGSCTCDSCTASIISGGTGGGLDYGYGFGSCTCTDCIADQITGSTAIGFKSCSNTNSTCTTPQPANGCIVA
jgi:hypothetical protein